MCTFEGYGTDGILEDIMDKTADAISNGDNSDDEDWDDEDWDDWNDDDCIDEE